MEFGADGRWIRQVQLHDDGTAIKDSAENWPMNSPTEILIHVHVRRISRRKVPPGMPELE